jgi:hypothetical protein
LLAASWSLGCDSGGSDEDSSASASSDDEATTDVADDASGGAGSADEGSTDDLVTDDAADSTDDSSDDGATAATEVQSGPYISEAPDDWEPPDDCGGIGNMCPNLSGCGDQSTCQLIGPVCVPSENGGLAGPSEERPYCAAYTCMTYEEASCFCTGEAADVTSTCSSPGAMAGLCVGQGRSCIEDECCSDLLCVERDLNRFACEIPCEANEDCESDCCTDRYDTGQTICADADACVNVCDREGEACQQGSSTTPNSCCRGTCVDSETADFAGCRYECNTDADCDSGCCQPFSNSSSGFCVDAAYCTCEDVGAECGVDRSQECCDGLTCYGTEEQGYSCTPSCMQDADCEEGPCLIFADVDYGVCPLATQECTPGGEPCDGASVCCEGFACLGGDDAFFCEPSCTTDEDCEGGVCLLIADGSVGVCSTPPQ